MTKTSLNLRGPSRRGRLLAGAPVAFVLSLLLAACQTAPQTDQAAASQGAPVLLRLADDTRAGGDLATAADLYRRAAELDPKDPAALAGLGDTLGELHAYAEAAAAYRAGLRITPNPMEAKLHRGLALALMSLNEPQAALTELQAAIAQKPDDSHLYNVRGIAHDLVGQHDLAQQDYRKGLELAPGDEGLRNNYGLSLALSGDYSKAAAELAKLADAPGSTARHRLNLALVYGLAGEDAKAAAIARTALDERAVASNLAYYAMLRGLDDADRAAAILAGRPPSAAAASLAKREPATAAPVIAENLQPVPPKAIPLIHTAPPASPPSPSSASNAPMKTAMAELGKVQAAAELPADARGTSAPATKPSSPDNLAANAEKAPPQGGAVAAKATSDATPPAVQAAAPDASATAAPHLLKAKDEVAAVDASLPPAPATAAATASPPAPLQVDGAADQPSAAPAKPAAQDAAAATGATAPPADTAPVHAAAASSAELPPAQAADEPSAAKPESPPASATADYAVQLGSFSSEANAHRLVSQLQHKGYEVAVVRDHDRDGRDWFVVRAGTYPSPDEAAAAARHMREAEQVPAVVVHLHKASRA